jgi:peptidoglycan/LPS O-acetylase OafA/YrhL
MKRQLTNIALYATVVVVCIAAYFISRRIIEQKTVSEQIQYRNPQASEVFIVWGFANGSMPDRATWPAGSFLKDELVWTPTSRIGDSFSVSLNLPKGTHYYYWMVQVRNAAGAQEEKWDTGDPNASYYRGSISYGWLRPGFFVLLAGVLPLWLSYRRSRKKPLKPVNASLVSGYIPQLDALRAVAVILVIIHHWLPAKAWIHHIPNGPLGVNIFFVLSGFLITSILLKEKVKLDQGTGSIREAFKNFYFRRTLRIFPIYYLLLIVLWILQDTELLTHPVYYFSYASNILFFIKEAFPARISHLWSLAVEEQFYVIWPWLILLANRRTLPYLISTFIVVGIATNYVFPEKGWWIEILTPACFDAFAIGGLFAFLTIYRGDIIESAKRFFTPLFLIIVIATILDTVGYSVLPRRTIHALLAVSVIYYCLYLKSNRPANLVLKNRWLIELGKISYGVYLYHLFVPELWQWIIAKARSNNMDLLFNSRVPTSFSPIYLFIQEAIVLLIICRLSWIIIEKPINSLKKHFEYKTSPLPPVPKSDTSMSNNKELSS